MSATPDSAPVTPRGSLPSGTVTFAFTDIEGSTQRWERDRAAMQEAVRRHDGLMRTAIAEHGGYVFKTVGDAFCAAFARPEDAVAAMLAAQRALAAEDFSAVDGLRVRMAIHTGTTDERDGDYFGHAVNRVARLLAIGHGGQVLVSGVTTDLVQGALPAQASLRDLGEHRLKDLTRPEHVYQLLAPDLPADFAALRSLDALPNNLPRMLTSFIGRDAEVSEITGLLEKHRLVTLVGSGGIGKTRTSLQVAANLLDGSGDGVWFMELAPLASGDYIPSTVTQVLGLTLPTDGDPVENLARALKAKHMLLVFDNCEHLVEAAASVVAALLHGCPRVYVLASSRQALGIAGEATYRMPSLDVPSEGDDLTFSVDDVTRYAATALFVERARAVDQRFSVTCENAPTIAEICRRLDGIPLAIELAAARVKILSPRQLRERLDERFRVLTGGSRDVLPRQQTLRALIDWSHNLLDERERTLFRRLGTFINGFTLEGGTAVGSGDGLDELDVFDVLASLVDKSLVLAEPAGDALRYRLLESTRVYAREKRAAAGEAEACETRRLRFLRDVFAEVRARVDRVGRLTELNDVLTTELEDVRAVLEGALRGLEVTVGGELLADIGTGWQNVGLTSEGIARIEAFLAALAAGEPRLLTRLLVALAFLTENSGRHARAFDAATQAVAYARMCADRLTLAQALIHYGSAARFQRLDAAESALDEAEAIPDLPAALRLRLLRSRAVVAIARGDYAMAARASEQLRKDQRLVGNAREERVASMILAEAEHARGQTRRAIPIIREMLPTLRTQRDRTILVIALMNFAGYLAAVDEPGEGRAAAREVVTELAAREPESTFVAVAIEHLALALALDGDLPRAAALAGYAEASIREQRFEREFTETTTHDRLAALLRERVAPDELTRLLTEGSALTAEDAVALALAEP